MADVTMTSTAKYSDTSESESDIESNYFPQSQFLIKCYDHTRVPLPCEITEVQCNDDVPLSLSKWTYKKKHNVEACPQPPPPSPVAGLDKSFHTEETIHPDIMKFKEPFLDQIILYKDHVFLDCIGDYYYRYMKVVVGLGVKNAKECGFQSGGLYSAESVIGRIQSTNASIDTINKVKKTLTEPLMRGYLDCQQRLKSGLRQTDMSVLKYKSHWYKCLYAFVRNGYVSMNDSTGKLNGWVKEFSWTNGGESFFFTISTDKGDVKRCEIPVISLVEGTCECIYPI